MTPEPEDTELGEGEPGDEELGDGEEFDDAELGENDGTSSDGDDADGGAGVDEERGTGDEESRELNVYRGELAPYVGGEGTGETPAAAVGEEPPESAGTPVSDVRSEVLADVKAYFDEQSPDAAFADPPSDEFVDESWFDFDYLEEYDEVERFWLTEPFAYGTIIYDESEREYRYHVVEPALDTFEQYVRQDLVTILRNNLLYLDVDEEVENREQAFTSRAKDVIATHAATVEDGTLHKVLYYLLRDFIHYGPIDPLMGDPNIEDVSCDGQDLPVYVYHREYRDLATNISFSKRRLNSFVVRLAQRSGKSITVSDPLVDASLPDGSRIQLTLGPDVSTRGSNFTIRKFADIPYTPIDLVRWGTFGVDQMVYFWLAIEHNKSLIFAGGTGSGKTTSMNAVSFFIPPHAKVVSIEDTREVDLPHQNWIASLTRSSASGEGRGEVTTYDLLQSALRQRPEYLLVGEIRTENRVALTFFQAMGTGHTAYTTVHADSIEAVLARLQNPPLSVPGQMIADLDIVSVQRQSYVGDDRVRRNVSVTELGAEGDTDDIETREIFRRDPDSDAAEWVGESEVLRDIAAERGWTDEELASEFADRRRVLQYLLDEGITGYGEVSATIHMYAKDPDYVMNEIEAGTLDLDDAPVEIPEPNAAHDAAVGVDVDVEDVDGVEALTRELERYDPERDARTRPDTLAEHGFEGAGEWGDAPDEDGGGDDDGSNAAVDAAAESDTDPETDAAASDADADGSEDRAE